MRAGTRLPILYIPTVWHVGDLSRPRAVPAHHDRLSNTGGGLSVSLDPDAWGRIARLGENPVWALSRHDAGWLDLQALDDETVNEALLWARDQGLVDIRQVWKVRWFDSEIEDFRSILCDTRDEADAEAAELEECDASIIDIAAPTLTEAGLARCGAAGRRPNLFDATDLAIGFWAEDVLAPYWPDLVGVWYRGGICDDTDPDEGSLFQSKLATLRMETVDQWPDSLEIVTPYPVPVDPAAMRSPYVFVTSCVNGDGDAIMAMTDDPCADIDLDAAGFAGLLGVTVDNLAITGGAVVSAQFGFSRLADITDDPHVRYAASAYQGLPCLYLVHSAVEFVFQRHGLLACRNEAMIAQRAMPEETPEPLV